MPIQATTGNAPAKKGAIQAATESRRPGKGPFRPQPERVHSGRNRKGAIQAGTRKGTGAIQAATGKGPFSLQPERGHSERNRKGAGQERGHSGRNQKEAIQAETGKGSARKGAIQAATGKGTAWKGAI